MSILFKPNFKIGKVELGTYWLVALFFAIILVLTKSITLREIEAGLTKHSSINPIKILVLFLSMTVQSIFLDEIGMFRYCANVALSRAKGSQLKLFFSLYIVTSVLTVFTSNDIIILTFTPFICYFAKNARINPIPFLFTEFVAANTWSMALIIGNPTNVYLAQSNGINFISYARVMAFPTLTAGLTACLFLLVLFREDFAKPLERSVDDFQIEDKGLLVIGLLHLGLCTVLLVVSSYIGIEMWFITMCFALSLFLVSSIYMLTHKLGFKVLLACLKRMPWELVPFVISMFVFVLAIDGASITQHIVAFLGTESVVYKYGVSSFLVANLVNNIPMSVLFSSVVNLVGEHSLEAAYAAIVGSNLGAYFTPVGALAGIMWAGILKKHDVEFNFLTYIRYGAAVSIPTLYMALLSLSLILKGWS